MHPEAGSGLETDLVNALIARVDDMEAQLRATAAAVDEKSLKEFRRTLEAVSKHDAKFEERVTNRVDVVADRLETLARTLSTTSAALAAKDGEIAQLRRELQSGAARVESAVADARRGFDPAALAELKRTIAELSKQRLPRGLEGRFDDLGAKVTMLAQRIDTVSSTVSTTAAGLAGRDGDVTALRRAHEADSDRMGAELDELRRAIDPAPLVELRQSVAELRDQTFGQRRSTQLLLDEAGAKTEALVAGLRQTVAALSAKADVLEQADGETARILDGRISAMSDKVEDVAVHLDSLAAASAETAERLATRDLELEAEKDRFHEATARVDGLVRDLARSLAEFPDPDSLEHSVEARLDERLASVRTEVDALAARLDALGTRLDATDRDRTDASGEVARLSALVEVERASVRSKLDALAAAQENALGAVAADELELRVAGVADRCGTLERDREAMAVSLDRLSIAFDAERASVQTQLEALATALSWSSERSSLEERLGELTDRLEEVERHGAAVASKVSHASTLVPTALRSLEARIDEVAPPRRPEPDLDDAARNLFSAPSFDLGTELEPAEVEEERDYSSDETREPATTAVVPLRAPDT